MFWIMSANFVYYLFLASLSKKTRVLTHIIWRSQQIKQKTLKKNTIFGRKDLGQFCKMFNSFTYTRVQITQDSMSLIAFVSFSIFLIILPTKHLKKASSTRFRCPFPLNEFCGGVNRSYLWLKKVWHSADFRDKMAVKTSNHFKVV